MDIRNLIIEYLNTFGVARTSMQIKEHLFRYHRITFIETEMALTDLVDKNQINGLGCEMDGNASCTTLGQKPENYGEFVSVSVEALKNVINDIIQAARLAKINPLQSSPLVHWHSAEDRLTGMLQLVESLPSPDKFTGDILGYMQDEINAAFYELNKLHPDYDKELSDDDWLRTPLDVVYHDTLIVTIKNILAFMSQKGTEEYRHQAVFAFNMIGRILPNSMVAQAEISEAIKAVRISADKQPKAIKTIGRPMPEPLKSEAPTLNNLLGFCAERMQVVAALLKKDDVERARPPFELVLNTFGAMRHVFPNPDDRAVMEKLHSLTDSFSVFALSEPDELMGLADEIKLHQVRG